MSTRHLVRLALLLTIVFGAQARFLPYLPGDPVPASNVAAHKYDEVGLVEKVK